MAGMTRKTFVKRLGAGSVAMGAPPLGRLCFGMMLVGRYWEESTIYRAAAAFEQESE